MGAKRIERGRAPPERRTTGRGNANAQRGRAAGGPDAGALGTAPTAVAGGWRQKDESACPPHGVWVCARWSVKLVKT